jgi:predicted transcriptional regulator of viral defense system
MLGKICKHESMSFDAFRRHIGIEVFDYQLISDYFCGLKKVRDKISSLVAEGKIIRVKKGLYVFGEHWRRSPLNLEVIANLLYGPSCISFEYALTRYGLIAERSQVITSLAIGKTKVYHTPLGQFEYRAIDRNKFKVGIEYRDLGKEGGYFIASREKALADLVYRTAGIRTLAQLRHYLFEEMRLDEAMFRTFDFHKLNEISIAYNKKSVSMLGEL